MIKKTKYVLWGFLPIDYKATEIYLEEMAAKGWMLDRIGRTFARFRAIKPSQIKFCVDVYKEGGPFTPEDTDESITYRDLCAEAGWSYISAQDYLQYFHAEVNAHPTPLQTDDVLEQLIVDSTMGNRERLALLFMTLFSIYVLLKIFPYTHKNLTHYVGVFSTFIFPVLIVITVLSSLNMLRWLYKMKRDIQKGYPRQEPTLKAAKRRAYAVNVPMIIIVCMLIIAIILDAIFSTYTVGISIAPLVIGGTLGTVLRYFIKKRSKDKSQAFRFVFVMIIILFCVVWLFEGWYFDQEREAYYTIEPIPNRYDLLSVDSIFEEDLIRRTFDYGSTPFVPVQYTYSALDNQSLSIGVDYYQAFNLKMSKFIFESVVDDLEHGIKFQGMRLFEEEMTPDEQLKLLWQVDALEISESRAFIVIRKGDVVMKINGDIDFNADHIIRSFMALYRP